jgi:hypothetical protein
MWRFAGGSGQRTRLSSFFKLVPGPFFEITFMIVRRSGMSRDFYFFVVFLGGLMAGAVPVDLLRPFGGVYHTDGLVFLL